MTDELHVPDGLAGLATFLGRLEEAERIDWCLKLGLLSTQCECSYCGTLTALEVPVSDQARETTRHTACASRECRKKHRYRRTIFFKSNTIFNICPNVDMILVVCVLYCFVVKMSPLAAATLVGGGISRTSVRRLYQSFRKACAWYFRERQWRKLGGEALPNDPDADKAVLMDNKLRHVVEFDECACACVCVCVCVCTDIADRIKSLTHIY
jgi:hypothetical protein